MTRLALLILPLLAGCAMIKAPGVAPLPAPPTQWSIGAAQDGASLPVRDWWHALGDPGLDLLVADAIKANHDLRAAEANLRAARALVREARTGLLPTGGISSGIERRRDPAAPQTAQFPELSGAAFPTQTIATAGFDVSWELDLFGRIGATASAARADAVEALWQRRETEAGVVAATVRAWLEARHAARRGALLAKRCATLSDVARMIAASVTAGSTRPAQSSAAQAVARECMALHASVDSEKRNALRRLATLTGHGFDALLSLEISTQPIAMPTTIAVGDPANTLRRRPDVGAAESRLRSTLARAGAERAALYPRIELIGSAGLTAPPASFGLTPSLGFAIGPRLSWDVFNLPRIRARVRAADATAEARLETWHSVTLKALEEADTALENWSAASRAATASMSLADASAMARRDAEQRHKSGLGSPLAAAQTREAELAARIDAENSTHAARTAWATAQLALGMGWQE